MILRPVRISARDKQILTGLYLSKFDELGLRTLGFESFTEAFNLLGYGLGSRPASLKNYRDEFDPLFPNPRKGWHKRERRDYCLKIADQYKNLKLPQFAELISSFLGTQSVDVGTDEPATESAFARRLATGVAAEQYFRSVQPDLNQLKDCDLEDTTAQGCGYDFRLWPHNRTNFLAVEVKGLADKSGSISLTAKEHATATALADRYFLFIVKNFRDAPFHEVHADPISGPLLFARQERTVVQVSWQACA